MTELTVYLIAGEASGDTLGAGLMRSLKAQHPNIRFHGVGGEKMAAEGLKSLFPYHELSLFGIVEVLPHAMRILSRVNMAVEDILNKHPDVVITIDVPGFNLRVAEKLRKENIGKMKLVHYVAPTVWAYKPERAELCAKLFDHMLVLLPFEPPYFTQVGLACTYIGHPVTWTGNPKGNASTFRQKYNIDADAPILSLLPGSRSSEIKRHMPIFAKAVMMAALVMKKPPVLVVPVAARLLEDVAYYFQNCPFRTVLLADDSDKKDAFAASELAITKSGTIALEIAREGTPMVVAYRTHPITAHMLKKIVQVPYVNLLNIIKKQQLIPELLQENCTPLLIANAASALLQYDEIRQKQQKAIAEALSLMQPLEPLSPDDLAAKTVFSVLEKV